MMNNQVHKEHANLVETIEEGSKVDLARCRSNISAP